MAPKPSGRMSHDHGSAPLLTHDRLRARRNVTRLGADPARPRGAGAIDPGTGNSEPAVAADYWRPDQPDLECVSEDGSGVEATGRCGRSGSRQAAAGGSRAVARDD